MNTVKIIIFLVLWIGLIVYLSGKLSRRIKSVFARRLVQTISVALMLPLPVLDEIVGGFQFRELCKKNSEFRFQAPKPEGRLTRFINSTPSEPVLNVSIPILQSRIEYVDVSTGELVVEFYRFTAEGGVLAKFLALTENRAPIILGSNHCSPEQERGETVSRTFNFSVVN